MPAGDMTGFVRDNADDLVRRVSRCDQAGVNAHIEAAGERVGRRIADQPNIDLFRGQAGSAKDRYGIIIDPFFDFLIAQ